MRATEHRTGNIGHGRIEKRSGRVLDLADHPDKARLPRRTAALRIEREPRNAGTGKVGHETVHGLTSLPPEQATAELVLALVRGYLDIELDLIARMLSERPDDFEKFAGHVEGRPAARR